MKTSLFAEVPDDAFAKICAFCTAHDLETLSACNDNLNRSVLGSSLALFHDIFKVTNNTRPVVLPKCRGDLFRLLERSRFPGNLHRESEVFAFVCASGYTKYLQDYFDGAKVGSMQGDFATALTRLDTGGFGVLHLASMNGHCTIVCQLLRHKAFVDQTDRHRRTALWWACRGGHSEVVRLLVSNGARAVGDCCPIMASLSAIGRTEESIECVGMLSECLAVRLERNRAKEMLNPLDARVRAESVECVLVLLEALNQIVLQRRSAEILQALLSALSPHTELCCWIHTVAMTCLSVPNPLIAAAGSNQVSLLESLLVIFSLTDCTQKSRKSALFVAAEHGHSSAVCELLRLGVPVGLVSSSGRNCLHIAVERNQTQTVELLCLHVGIGDIVQLNSSQISPFILAVNRGRLRMVFAMLRAYQRCLASDSRAKPDAFLNMMLQKYACRLG